MPVNVTVDTGITDKQENFIYAFLETGNAAESYRRAFNVDPEKATNSWIYVESSRLLASPNISLRINELREAVAKAHHYTLLDAADELEKARALAMEEKQSAAAVSAVSAKIKLYGMDKPQKFMEVGKDGEPKEDVSSKDLARALAAVLAKGIRPDGSD